jgi:hypothetical protein
MIASINIKANEPVMCHEKKVMVITSIFCNAKITATAPITKPNIKSIIISLLYAYQEFNQSKSIKLKQN